MEASMRLRRVGVKVGKRRYLMSSREGSVTSYPSGRM